MSCRIFRKISTLKGCCWARGSGFLFTTPLPVDGEYIIIRVRLWRNTSDLMRGMEDPHQKISLDCERVRLVTVGGHGDFVKMAGNPGEFGTDLDQRLAIRMPVKAGTRTISATTVLRSHAEKDNLIEAFIRTTVDGEDITGDPSVDRLTVEGPFNRTGSGDTASRRKILIFQPASAKDELPCAHKILSTLTRRAYRGPLKHSDLEEPALQWILASPEFLFRFEPDPANAVAGVPYRVDDLALASRLSFFLWSSIPDETLRNLASPGKLKDPAVRDQQVKRMLADPKAEALTDNFAEQWLFLRNLKTSSPNLVDSPDFDDNLQEAMLQETNLYFESIQHEDRSVLDLLNADYTFVNKRVAKHYGIPNVYGSQFCRVPMTDLARRAIAGAGQYPYSYPNRTSPVQRGKWIRWASRSRTSTRSDDGGHRIRRQDRFFRNSFQWRSCRWGGGSAGGAHQPPRSIRGRAAASNTTKCRRFAGSARRRSADKGGALTFI